MDENEWEYEEERQTLPIEKVSLHFYWQRRYYALQTLELNDRAFCFKNVKKIWRWITHYMEHICFGINNITNVQRNWMYPNKSFWTFQHIFIKTSWARTIKSAISWTWSNTKIIKFTAFHSLTNSIHHPNLTINLIKQQNPEKSS